MLDLRFESKRQACTRYKTERTALLSQIKEGVFPPGIALASNKKVWLSTEVDRMIAARAAGKSPDELRELVARIVKERTRLPEIVEEGMAV